MITIKSKKDKVGCDTIKISGHAQHDICAAISSITYTCINILMEYDNNCVSIDDNKVEDYMYIVITKHDKFIDLVMKVMLQMFRDAKDQVPTGSISLEVENEDISS